MLFYYILHTGFFLYYSNLVLMLYSAVLDRCLGLTAQRSFRRCSVVAYIVLFEIEWSQISYSTPTECYVCCEGTFWWIVKKTAVLVIDEIRLGQAVLCCDAQWGGVYDVCLLSPGHASLSVCLSAPALSYCSSCSVHSHSPESQQSLPLWQRLAILLYW